jgi:hypothetical protein
MADVPHTPERETVPSRALPLRLPPVPHRTDQLIEKVVERPLAGKQWDSGLTPTEVLGRAAKHQPCADLSDSALLDPHLQEFWQRKFRGSPPSSNNKKSNVSPSRKTTDGSACSSNTPQRLAIGSKRRMLLSSPEASQEPVSPSSSTCQIPLNTSPFQVEEVLCLRTLLTVPSEIQLSLDNLDVFWLRDVILRKKTVEQAAPPTFKTLANFDIDILSSSQEHHTPLVRFHNNLINSPRSAVVLLRNGVQLYDILKRPPEYYVRATETVTRSIVDSRYKAAEFEREGVVAELRRQYSAVCAEVSLEAVCDLMASSAESKSEEAQSVARERAALEGERFERMEERDRHIADMRRQAALDAALSSRSKAQRNKACREAAAKALRDRGKELHRKLAESRRVADKILVVREMLAAEAGEAMSEKRAIKAQRIAELRKQKLAAMTERSAETEQRIQRAREMLAEQEIEHAAETKRLLEKKRQRAEEFLERKAQEYAELQHRSDDKNKNQLEVMERSRQAAEDLRDRIEAKMRQAEQRYEELQAEKLENLRCAKILHREKEEKILAAVEAAARAQEELAMTIRQQGERADQLLAQRLIEAERERVRVAELHAFSMGQKNRIVLAKQQQVQFQRLMALTRLTRRDEERAEVLAMEEELARLGQASKKSMTVRRHMTKEAFLKRNIMQEKETFLSTMRLEAE